jgi:hypothetical protein
VLPWSVVKHKSIKLGSGCSQSVPRDLKIFVVDTGPLITLAVAQSLDYLLFVDADIVVPDAVLHEATYDAARLGAQDIIEWVKAHRSHIEIAPTKAYQVFDAARKHSKICTSLIWENARQSRLSNPTACRQRRGVLLCERRFSGGSSCATASGSSNSSARLLRIPRPTNPVR